MEKILEEIQYNWTHLHDENEYKIFRKYAEEGRLYIIFYLSKYIRINNNVVFVRLN